MAERRIFHFKFFKLITPDYAAELGLPAESPVLVSPYHMEPRTCHNCQHKHSALVYQHNYTTKAQHPCRENGGIYHFTGIHLPSEYPGRSLTELTYGKHPGWQSILSVQQRIQDMNRFISKDWPYEVGTSLRVKPLAIQAFCRDAHQHGGYFPIKTGQLQEFRNYDLEGSPSGQLDPFCDEHRQENNEYLEPRLRFSIREDGSVGFSHIPPK